MESWCTWHLNQEDDAEYTDMNRAQATKLTDNIAQKRVELLNKVVTSYLGRTPSQRSVKKNLEIVEFEELKGIEWYYWGSVPILVFTDPVSRINETQAKDGGRYYLKWYWKDLTKMDVN